MVASVDDDDYDYDDGYGVNEGVRFLSGPPLKALK